MYRLFSRLPRSLILWFLPGLLVIGASGAHPAYAVNSTRAVAPTIVAVSEIIDLKNFNTKCLSEENVGPVIDACIDTEPRQDWKIVFPNGPNDFLLQNALTGACLSILNNNTSQGAQVNTHGCDFSERDRFELWTLEFPGGSGFTWIANEGDLDVGETLVMHPSGCGATSDLGIFMNVPGQCNADKWTFPFPRS
jgi:hypothetical protein